MELQEIKRLIRKEIKKEETYMEHNTVDISSYHYYHGRLRGMEHTLDIIDKYIFEHEVGYKKLVKGRNI